jgi:hypothetical protein
VLSGETPRMHTGQQYHEVIQRSGRDRRTRAQFQRMALSRVPAGADILDFGAGTGLDAKVFATHGHRTFVYEPDLAMRTYLTQYCADEIEGQMIVPVSSPLHRPVHAVTANFAVLNHFADHAQLFADFATTVPSGGFVLANLLNPYYLGDVRYRWWRENLRTLLRSGRYAIASESRIHRFSPAAIVRAAAPHFRLERLTPRGIGLAGRYYMFLLLRRQ